MSHDETDGLAQRGFGTLPSGMDPTERSDLFLEDHLEKALENATDSQTRFHIRSALQRCHFD